MGRLLKGIFWGCIIIAVAGLVACVPDADMVEGQHGNRSNGIQAKQTNKYYHLKGYLADMPVTMELLEETDYHNEYGRFFRGFYRYDEYGGPISVYGNLENGNRLILTEQGSWDDNPHTFQGRWNDSGNFSGKWLNGNGADVYNFRLVLDNNVVPLEGWGVEDSLKAFAHWEHSPTLYYGAEWLKVKEEWNKPAVRAFLETEIAKGLLGETYATEEALPKGLNKQCADYFAEYQSEMQSMRDAGLIDSLAEPDAFLSTSYNYNSSVQVYFNSPDLLTLGYTDYSYTGGAHGMFGTRVASYDLRAARSLSLDDILLPGFEKQVGIALERAARLKYNLKPRESLDAILFEKEIQPNGNFGLTDKGVFFVYTPYEIAPYAAGEIELYVSFEQISEFVRPEWLPAAPVE